MHDFFKSTVLSVGLLAGIAATAYGQAVSSLPPSSAAPAAVAMPPEASAKISPNPGGNGAWKEEHYQAVQNDNDPARHPYSSRQVGPRAN